jgi:HSP20 family molecular chaperone IbpA
MATENKCENCNCHVPITLRDFFWQDPFFSANWDDFDKLHEKMVQETKDLWGRFDQQLKSLEVKDEATKEVSENAAEPESSGSWFFPRSLMRLPSLFSGEMTKDLVHKEDQTIKVRDDDKAFEVSLDTRNYRPDEIKVNVVDKVLSIEGKHEEKSEDGNKFTSKRFFQKYALPVECPADQVVSNLSADGVLLVTAPKLSIKDAGRSVPIQMKN